MRSMIRMLGALALLSGLLPGCGDDSQAPKPDLRRDASVEGGTFLEAGVDAALEATAGLEAGTAKEAGTAQEAGTTKKEAGAAKEAGTTKKEGGVVDAISGIDAVAPSFTAPISWDFESSSQGLLASGDWEWGQISFSAGSGCSTGYVPPTASANGTGKGMWGTKLNDCYTGKGNNTGYSSTSCSNTNPLDDSILQFKVTIPSSWTSATLTYYDWIDVFGEFDWMEVRINGSSVKSYCVPGTKPTAWVKETIDLSSYAGQTITIAFHFLASTVVQYAGWYLDDLSISGS